MAGYLVLGIGFGLMMSNAGYGPLWSVAMAVFIYAGSMQYLAVSLMVGGATLPVVALTTLMVNARHIFYGISMIERYRHMGAIKPYLIYSLTDETYSLLVGGRDDLPLSERRRYYTYVSAFDHLYWVAGCAAGALVGAVLPVGAAGLDFALTALFLTVATEQWLTTRRHLPALIGVGATLVCLLIFGAGSFLLPSMLLIAGALLCIRAVKGDKAV